VNRIPLHARDGSVRAYALVDDDVFERLGDLRWSLTSHGYVARTEGGHKKPSRHYYLHREVLGLSSRAECADHIDGDKLDNRRENLRCVAPYENGQNVPGRRATSEHRGVSWSAHAKMWRATAYVDGKQRNVGYFKREQDAAVAVSLFRRVYMPYAVEDGRRPVERAA
jgi:hypothetical protein